MAQKPNMKGYIAEVFLELLETEPYDDITVRDITKAAEISNTTFYRHFKDKYDLAEWIFRMKTRDIVEQNDDVTMLSSSIVEALTRNSQNSWFKKLSDKYYVQNSLFEVVCNVSYQHMKQMLSKRQDVSNLPEKVDFALKVYAHIIAYTQRTWLLNGSKETPEQIGALLVECIPAVLVPYFYPNDDLLKTGKMG